MSILTIQGLGLPGCDPPKLSMRMGESATFGACACAGCALDLPLPAAFPVNFRGEILVGRDRWRIANLSATELILIRHVDEGAQPVAALPGEWLSFRHDMAVLEPVGTTNGMSVIVFFSPENSRPALGTSCPAIEERPEPELNLGARYFAVLAALCGPTLLEGPLGEVPTSSRIAARLALTTRAVDSHIDYLVGKFGIPVPNMRSAGWKRRALIEYVQQHDNIAQALRRRLSCRPTDLGRVKSREVA